MDAAGRISCWTFSCNLLRRRQITFPIFHDLKAKRLKSSGSQLVERTHLLLVRHLILEIFDDCRLEVLRAVDLEALHLPLDLC